MSYIPKEDKKNLKRLAQFQLKDFTKGDENIESELSNGGSTLDVNTEQAIKAMDLRQQVMVFPKAKFIQNGYERIDN